MRVAENKSVFRALLRSFLCVFQITALSVFVINVFIIAFCLLESVLSEHLLHQSQAEFDASSSTSQLKRFFRNFAFDGAFTSLASFLFYISRFFSADFSCHFSVFYISCFCWIVQKVQPPAARRRAVFVSYCTVWMIPLVWEVVWFLVFKGHYSSSLRSLGIQVLWIVAVFVDALILAPCLCSPSVTCRQYCTLVFLWFGLLLYILHLPSIAFSDEDLALLLTAGCAACFLG